MRDLMLVLFKTADQNDKENSRMIERDKIRQGMSCVCVCVCVFGEARFSSEM